MSNRIQDEAGSAGRSPAADAPGAETGTFELNWPGADQALLRGREGTFALPEPLLLGYLVWFCRLRWGVVGILGIYGALARIPGLLPRLGLAAPADWSLLGAAILAACNVLFFTRARRIRRREDYQQIIPTLWMQIICDLLVLTMVAHFAGSLETYVPFAYLFHIVLACIFFSVPSSLLVTALSCLLYTGCLAAEWTGLLPPSQLYVSDIAQHISRTPTMMMTNTLSALSVWLAVWYLATHLSAMVRKRDAELAQTNRQLTRTQREKTRHMLRTTHELKSPLGAIHANTQLLLKGYCGPLSTEAMEVARRIAARSHRLSLEIQEMLQLANLRSVEKPPDPVSLDLADVIRGCVALLAPRIEDHQLLIDEDLEPASVVCVEDYVKMLLSNLLSNAVSYSHAGGTVHVRCHPHPPRGPVVSVEDHGIGISPQQLPHIFEEYYRTPQAVQHNKESSGLGLAIVQEVAHVCGIRIRVASRPGGGTRFELDFPALSPAAPSAMQGDTRCRT